MFLLLADSHCIKRYKLLDDFKLFFSLLYDCYLTDFLSQEVITGKYIIILSSYNLKRFHKLKVFLHVIIVVELIFISIHHIDNDIDGPTLELMNSMDKISTLIPKFKQQLAFLSEREKLFKKSNENVTQAADPSSMPSTNCNLSSASESVSGSTSDVSICNTSSESDQSTSAKEINELFPEKYIIPPLPNSLVKDIQEGTLNKFGPHCSHRQILIELVVYDLINTYNLL